MSEAKVYSNNLLNLKISDDDESIIVSWTGKSTDREPGKFITPLLMEAIKEGSDKHKRVIMDFQELTYMNSSTITPLIKILERASRGNTEISVLYKKSLHWQELSFTALEIFTTDDKRVEIKGL